jgi:hypothetical protein
MNFLEHNQHVANITTEKDMPAFGTSNDGLIECAKWIKQNLLVTEVDEKVRYSLELPGKPLSVSCTLFWNGKEHFCSCGHPSRPCAHLIACLHYSGAIAHHEDAFALKKKTFKSSNDCPSKRKLLKGSRKTPVQNYYKNPD